MDKYTVDLDKVLNDFEYSELTDQYSTSAASYLNNVHTSTSQIQPTRSTPVKHSINNVFQSLNDYLNTDIGVKSSISIDSNLSETRPISFSPKVNSDEDLPQEVIDTSNLSLELSSNDEELKYEVTTPTFNLSQELNLALDLNQESNSSAHLNQELNSTLDLDEEESLGLHFNNDESSSSDLVPNFSDRDLEIVTETQADNTSLIKEEEQRSPNELLDETPVCDELKVISDLAPSIEVETSEDESLSSIEEEKIKTESCLTQNVEFNLPTTEKLVSFDQNVELDESELQKYLEELENECETVSSEDKTETSRPSTLEICSPTQIDLVGEPGSTPYNNLYISESLPKAEVSTESDTESSRSISPTFSDASTELNESTASAESVVPETLVKNEIKSDDADKMFDEACGVTEENVVPSQSVALSNCIGYLPVNTDLDTTKEEIVEPKSEIEVSDPSPLNLEVSRVDLEMFKEAPMWIPDSDALSCMHCDIKFTMIKRRHHCRACGLVLCSKCCNMKYKLEFLDSEARVCSKCYEILNRDTPRDSDSSELSNSPNRPNPNNPMEYCSIIPPYQQVGASPSNPPPSVIVPVGVLKRQGSAKTRTNKSVMFCDGIRPGSELTDLDNAYSYEPKVNKKGSSPPPAKTKLDAPRYDSVTKSFIPDAGNTLPPTVTTFKSDVTFSECTNDSELVEKLKKQPLTFALHDHLNVHVKIINMDCCINKWAWCFSTEGMIIVGQDEIILIIEFLEDDVVLPKDVLLHLTNVYKDAKKGSSITENGLSIHNTSNFLNSKNHIGFLYIRPSFQCLQNVIVPKEPYLIGILIHRWEMPWAKIFPLRLILRLGAEYRYYPSPIISTRYRESVFVEIGHTIINLLADFRNFSYTLPNIRGLTIHMEDKNTTVEIPLNRYEQVLKSLNNSSDHILAFGGNFSVKADSHLVCIQDTQGNNENTYTTHAINIHNKPRKVTGASFIVFNGALKSTSGLTAKSSIIEDGLMIQIPPEHMVQIRESLRNMKNHTISCGCINSTSDETVNIVWVENDTNFNVGVLSAVDNRPLTGIPSIRVHNGKAYLSSNGGRMIKWTEVFILQNADKKGQEIDFSKLAENISRATCLGLVKYTDLLASNNFYKIGIRTTLHVENVSYSAGSNGTKLPPIYMRSLDNELIPVLHRITTNNLGEHTVVLELVFRILNTY